MVAYLADGRGKRGHGRAFLNVPCTNPHAHAAAQREGESGGAGAGRRGQRVRRMFFNEVDGFGRGGRRTKTKNLLGLW